MEKNKGLTITIITFVFLIVGIIGYFTYDYIKTDNSVERKINFKSETLNLSLNETFDMRDYIDLVNVEYDSVKFTIDDKNIAIIDEHFLIVPKEIGETIIGAKYRNASDTLKIVISK